MLTAKRAFSGEEISDTIVSILRDDPDWSALPTDTPGAVVRALRVCLAKNPKQRVGDLSEVRLALDGAFDTSLAPDGSPVVTASTWSGLPPFVWKTAVALLAPTTLAGLVWAYLARSATAPVVRFVIDAPEKTSFITNARNTAATFAMSPDGQTLAFTARDVAGKTLLWVRPIDLLTPRALAGTDEAAWPFWSPDSRFLAYMASGRLLRIAAAGGPPEVVCALNADVGLGGTWRREGVIVFNGGGSPGGLLRVPSAGGHPVPLIKGSGSFPSFLPDGRHVLFYAAPIGSLEGPGVYVASIDGGDPKRLLAADSGAIYDARKGDLLFERQGTLLAQRFNPKALALQQEPFPIVERINVSATSFVGRLSASVSEAGILAYGAGLASTAAGLDMTWMDRHGRTLGSVGPERTIAVSTCPPTVRASRHIGTTARAVTSG
jgi:hypothetical protein